MPAIDYHPSHTPVGTIVRCQAVPWHKPAGHAWRSPCHAQPSLYWLCSHPLNFDSKLLGGRPRGSGHPPQILTQNSEDDLGGRDKLWKLLVAPPTPRCASDLRCAMARGLGVPAARATTAGELADALRMALEAAGPWLIEACLA